MSDDIVVEKTGAWGVITLNRPKALNALNWDMVKVFLSTLTAWDQDDTVKAVLVKGAGEKAFCAGGDIRWLCDAAKDDPATACRFFYDEYSNNAKIYHFTKPYVALIDGIVMGGGVGVSVHGDYRVAGDKTMFAMPETGIGLFPDVGGGHFMSRLAGGLGLYLALTGQRMKAADCVYSGVATHYTPSDKHAELEQALLGEIFFGGLSANETVAAVLDKFSQTPVDPAPLSKNSDEIDRFFVGQETYLDLLSALKEDGGAFSEGTISVLNKMSPTSLLLTFEQMKRAASLDFDDVMKMEYRMVSRVMEGHDFIEGVRALIIDKDGAPQWLPNTVDDVNSQDIEAYFADLGDKELRLS